MRRQPIVLVLVLLVLAIALVAVRVAHASVVGTIVRSMFDPRAAAHVAAALVARPDLAPKLERVCTREAPRCRVRGVHDGDRWMNRRAWSRAVARGLLRPDVCPWHDFESGPWSTRGPFGTVAAYTVHYLGPCWPAWSLDVPLVAAVAAALRATSPACDRAPACRSWRGW